VATRRGIAGGTGTGQQALGGSSTMSVAAAWERTRRAVLRAALRHAPVVTGALLAGGAGVIGACGAEGRLQLGRQGQGRPVSSKPPVVIRITARQALEQDMWAARVPAFQRAYPHITVEPDLHAGNILDKIATLIAADTIGDVVHTHPSAAQPQRQFLGGSMRALDGYIGRDKLDLRQWYPQAVEAGRLDGKVISLPFKGKMATVALFYNQTLFEQGELAPPTLSTTLAELAEMAIKLTRPDGSQWGLAGILPKDLRTLTGMMRRWNAEPLSNDQRRATLHTPEARATFAWYDGALHRYRFMDPAADQTRLFREGKAAMLINVDFNQKTSLHLAAESQGFRYGATLAPRGPTRRRGGVWIPDALQLATRSPHPDAAWLAMLWFTDKETGLALARQHSQGTSTTPGARPDVYGDPAYLDHPLFPRVLQELDRDANELPENYQGAVPHNFRIQEFNKVLGPALERLWAHEAEPTPAFLKSLNGELQAVLELPR
jgi:ABC-type glycerol-3-phosphate transport system substrate-binding protein